MLIERRLKIMMGEAVKRIAREEQEASDARNRLPKTGEGGSGNITEEAVPQNPV